MVERTIKSLAKEYAAAFYEMNKRSPQFRRAFPSVSDYTRGVKTMLNGRKKPGIPNWVHFVDAARESLSTMLTLSDEKVTPLLKEKIADALIEDREMQLRGGQMVRQVHQVKMNGEQHAEG